jgi:hypothetical protein
MTLKDVNAGDSVITYYANSQMYVFITQIQQPAGQADVSQAEQNLLGKGAPPLAKELLGSMPVGERLAGGN